MGGSRGAVHRLPAQRLARGAGARPEDRVLDVATGTGMVARALVSCYGCQVIGLDQSADMLAAGSANGRPRVRAQGERLPFADESFDHVTFTYLLRYVDDPAATRWRVLDRVIDRDELIGRDAEAPQNVWQIGTPTDADDEPLLAIFGGDNGMLVHD